MNIQPVADSLRDTMNERIFDMARQSGASDENGRIAEHVFCFTKSELSSFAELIVRECMDCIAKVHKTEAFNEAYTLGVQRCFYKIEEHFFDEEHFFGVLE